MHSALCNSLASHCSSTWCPAPPDGPCTSRLVRCSARYNDKASVRAARTAAPDEQALPSDAAAVAEALGLAVPVRRTSRRSKQQQQQQAGKHSQPKQQQDPLEKQRQQQQPAPPQPQLQQGVQEHQTASAQDEQQQQQQQQPRIVLTPLQTAAAATGSALRSSPLGSWSAVGPWSPAAAAAAEPTTSSAAGTRQQQQAASEHNPNRLAGPADKHRPRNQHRQQGSRHEGVGRGPQGFQQQSRQRVTGRRQGQPKQQQQQQQAGPLLDASWYDLKGRQMTGYLSSASSISNLFNMVQNCSGSQAFNLVHVSTAFKVLTDLTTRQQTRQDLEALQPAEEPREQLLLLLDRLTASQITARTSAAAAAAAAAPGSTSSSSSSQDSPQRGSSRAAVGQPAAGRYVRSLSGIVHGCARIRHKLSWDTLLLLLDEFLLAAEEQQQQQQLQQMDQHSTQQMQHSSQRGSSNSRGGGSSSSSSSVDGSHQQPQAMCHALSLLCWGLSKAGFTCTSVYELSSSEQEQEQQLRLEQQQQYWQRLAAAGVHLVQYGSTRDISTLCYAFATGSYKDVALWGRLGPKVVSCLHSFTPQEFAQTLWAFATAEAEFRPLITEACLVAPQLAPGFTAQGLVNVLWALTALNGSVPPQLLAVTEDVCLRRDLDRFGSVNLAVLIAAHVRSGSMRIELAVAVNRAVIRTLPSFSAENLCRVVSGLAVLNCLQQPLMEVVVPRLLKHLRYGTVDVQTACHGVWGVAVTDPSRALELLPAMLQLATKHIHILTRSSDSTSKLCSAMSLARFRDDVFMDRLSSFLLGGGPTSTAASATAAAAGGSTAPVGSGTGMPMVSSDASGSSRIRPGSPLYRWQHRSVPQHLVSMASAMARLGFSQHTALLQLVIQQYLDRGQSTHSSVGSSSSTLQQQQAVLLLWACAVLDMQEPVQLLHQLLLLLKGVTDLPTASLAQLVQVHMWLQAVGTSGGTLATKIPKALLQNALHVWQQQLVPVVVLSELHREVLGQLTAMQLKPVAEALTADGMFSVDIMVKHKGCTVALEVLGPEHYTANKVTPIVAASQQQRQDQEQQQHVLMGPDLLRFRLLAARGFALAAVSSFEAAGAVSTPAGAKALRQLLQQKLSEAVDLHHQQQEATPQPSQDTISTEQPAGYPPASSKAKAKRGRRKEGKKDSTLQQPRQQSHGALSRFALQPGFSDAQDRMRHNRAVHLEQRSAVQQQQELGRRRTEAMQTLLSAAASKDGSSDGASKGDAAVPFADASASLDDQFDGLMVDEDFDIPLDLDDLSLPESKP